MIWAQATVVRATVMCFGIEAVRGFGRFVVIADAPIVFCIIGNKHFGAAVLRAMLEHENLLILKDNFSVYSPQTMRAEAQRKIIVGVISYRHLG